MPLKLSLPTQIQTLAIWRLSCGGRYEGVPPVNNQASNNFVVSQDKNVAVLLLIHFDKMKCPKIWTKRQRTTADHPDIKRDQLQNSTPLQGLLLDYFSAVLGSAEITEKRRSS